MEVLKIKFDELWPGFNTVDNDFTRILSKKFVVEISDNPDFFFFTHSYNGKRNYLNYKCHRIFLGWENERADWTMCDYVMDSDFVIGNPRHKRFPIWAGWDLQKLQLPKDPAALTSKKKFCCMLVSNGKAKERIDFFHKLSTYKKIDSGGRFMNNIGHPVHDKKAFIRDYKFVIAFENSSYPGYTTEKLIEPMFANTIPIYWGNPNVAQDFNTKSFINISDFPNPDAVIKYIIELDNNQEAFRKMAAEPWLNNNHVVDEMSNESLLSFFEFIIEDSKVKKPIADSWYKDKIHRARLLQNRAVECLAQSIGVKRGFR